jgi:hypothetical protein
MDAIETEDCHSITSDSPCIADADGRRICYGTSLRDVLVQYCHFITSWGYKAREICHGNELPRYVTAKPAACILNCVNQERKDIEELYN